MNDSLPDLWTSTVTMLMDLDDDDEDPASSSSSNEQVFVTSESCYNYDDPDALYWINADDNENIDMEASSSTLIDFQLLSPPCSTSFGASGRKTSLLNLYSLGFPFCVSPDDSDSDGCCPNDEERLCFDSLPAPPLFLSTSSSATRAAAATAANRKTVTVSPPLSPSYQLSAQALLEKMQRTDETRRKLGGHQTYVSLDTGTREQLFHCLQRAAAQMA
ncbi:hypothetical protein MPSEU_000922600 [Mayamaea pseudoterrestris]|nr:hypothetical protein MPSEU_000922600 [Mayamaea pseudoterrestris]